MQALREKTFRECLEVEPVQRLSQDAIEDIHRKSCELLVDPGITCFSKKVAEIYRSSGCEVSEKEPGVSWRVGIPEHVVEKALLTVPGQIVIGARNPANALMLDATKAHVYFGTGSETNVFLESHLETFRSVTDPEITLRHPVFREARGNVARLAQAAKLCNGLPNVDFFIRNVNLQDEDITEANKDVNVFLSCLLYMTKHVQAGITNIDRLQDVIRMAEIVAGGAEALRENPLISFIACPVKSPLQMVEDTSEKVVEIAKSGLPLVLSSSPQGGTTAPVQEEGIAIQINAEILAATSLTQAVNPGTPVLYGAVPVRARTDNLHDFYGAPEFIHYNMDCVQMARRYKIPCYSSAGVGDAKRPGMQALMEKVPVQMGVASAGPQYVHYAVGLLDRTNTFSPLQAILDDASLGLIKDVLRRPRFSETDTADAVAEIRKITASSGIFARGMRKQIRRGVVSRPYEFADDEVPDSVLEQAQEKLDSIIGGKGELLARETIDQIYREIPGLVDLSRFVTQ